VGRADFGVLAIGEAEEIRLFLFVVIGDAVIQLFSAIAAVLLLTEYIRNRG